MVEKNKDKEIDALLEELTGGTGEDPIQALTRVLGLGVGPGVERPILPEEERIAVVVEGIKRLNSLMDFISAKVADKTITPSEGMCAITNTLGANVPRSALWDSMNDATPETCERHDHNMLHDALIGESERILNQRIKLSNDPVVKES